MFSPSFSGSTDVCACSFVKGVEWSSSTHDNGARHKQMGEKSLCKCRKTEDFIKIFLSFTSTLQGLTTLLKRAIALEEYFLLITTKKRKLRRKSCESERKEREENSCVNKLIEEINFFGFIGSSVECIQKSSNILENYRLPRAGLAEVIK